MRRASSRRSWSVLPSLWLLLAPPARGSRWNFVSCCVLALLSSRRGGVTYIIQKNKTLDGRSDTFDTSPHSTKSSCHYTLCGVYVLFINMRGATYGLHTRCRRNHEPARSHPARRALRRIFSRPRDGR